MASILVVREYDNFSSTLEQHNFSVINCPTVKTFPIKDLSDFRATIAAIENYHGIFLTSPNATQIFIEILQEKNIEYGGKIYVLGKRSFDILKTCKLDLFFDESANTARELLDNIPAKELDKKRFLFVRGEKSLRVVPEFLARFAALDETIVYESRKITVETGKINEIREQIEKSEITAVCFFSPSGAESFLEQLGADVLHQTRIATIGKTTADYFGKHSLTVDFISARATAEDFASGLAEHLKV